jgi:hypothetical protein
MIGGPMADEKAITLFQSRDEQGTRSIWVTPLAEGRLRIEGQDLGPAVAMFGEDFTEYEWAWIVAAADVPRISTILGRSPDADPIASLRSWVSAANGRDPGQQLKDAGLELELWSRIGE